MLWLSNEDIRQSLGLDMKTALAELERAYTALACGAADERRPSRITTYATLKGSEGVVRALRTIEGRLGTYWAMRIFTGAAQRGVQRSGTVPPYEGKYAGIVLLWDVETGHPVAGMQDGWINWLATGGTAGLGMKYQIRQSAKSAAMIGAGWFGRAVFTATYLGHPFETANVYAPTYEHAAEFAREMRARFGVQCKAANSAEEAVHEADIVMCATNGSSPVIDGRWLRPGSSVVSIVGTESGMRGQQGTARYSRQEVDDETIRRAGTIMCTSKEQAEWDTQVELIVKIKQEGLSDWDKVVNLSDVVAGKSPGRKSDEEVTLFKQNCGMGIWYAALGGWVFERAKKRGVGRELPSDLFLEEMKP